jgi:hypothetical protein
MKVLRFEGEKVGIFAGKMPATLTEYRDTSDHVVRGKRSDISDRSDESDESDISDPSNKSAGKSVAERRRNYTR